MRDKEKVCGTCKWHKVLSASLSNYEEWVCNNEDSEFYALASEYDETCEDWEEKE